MGFTILSAQDTGHTLVPNSFIEQHMPFADGSFVKLYIYLLMLYQHRERHSDLSVSFLADHMECTEKDILRALRYWQREGLLKIQKSGEEIACITLCGDSFPSTPGTAPLPEDELSSPDDPSLAAAVEHNALPHSTSTDSSPTKISAEADDSIVKNLPPVAVRNHEFTAPPKQTYTPLQAEAFRKDAEIDRAIDEIEQLLGEPVSPAHLQTILYFMCDVGFSAELLVTLYRVATRKGKKKTNYIEAIGLNWASQGITTPQEAETESANFSGRYSIVARAFGIQGGLKPDQMKIVDGWEAYHFTDSIIAEACKRTVLQTGDANFPYLSKILKNWHKQQVNSLQDIEKCDESYKRQRKSTGASQKPAPKKNQFQNFPQRAYSNQDFNALEKQLLQGRKN